MLVIESRWCQNHLLRNFLLHQLGRGFSGQWRGSWVGFEPPHYVVMKLLLLPLLILVRCSYGNKRGGTKNKPLSSETRSAGEARRNLAHPPLVKNYTIGNEGDDRPFQEASRDIIKHAHQDPLTIPANRI